MKQLIWIGMAAALSVAAPAFALDPPNGDSSNKVFSGTLLTRDEAARRALARAGGGRILGIKLRNSNSTTPYFDVKLLDGGKVRVLRIDAK